MTRGAVSSATALSYVFWVLLAANVVLGALLLLFQADGVSSAGSGEASGDPDDCSVSEPFANLREAMSHASRLEAAGGRAEVREVVARGRPDHVVYVEPAASRDAARRVLRELEGQSIAGQVVDAGPLANAVTLGVFAEARAAEALTARVAAFGYPVRQMALERAHEGYIVLSREGAAGAPCGTAPGMPGAGAAVSG